MINLAISLCLKTYMILQTFYGISLCSLASHKIPVWYVAWLISSLYLLDVTFNTHLCHSGPSISCAVSRFHILSALCLHLYLLIPVNTCFYYDRHLPDAVNVFAHLSVSSLLKCELLRTTCCSFPFSLARHNLACCSWKILNESMNNSIYKFCLTTEMLESFLCKRVGSLEDLLVSQDPFPSPQRLFQIED